MEDFKSQKVFRLKVQFITPKDQSIVIQRCLYVLEIMEVVIYPIGYG